MPELMRETALPLAAKATRHLAERGIENARLDAELMLAAILGISRLDLYLQFDRPIDDHQLARYRELVRRRQKHEPLQYILGRAAFRKLDLQVDARVLIPRPETEVLVGHVLRWLHDGAAASSPRVLELGTGSGAIALSLAHEAGVHVTATDISADALAVAGANAERLGLAQLIELRLGNLWQPLRAEEQFHAIVANPPYVAETERAGLMPEVRDWEPELALFAGPDGLGVIEQIVVGARARLLPGGLLALEIGATQAARVKGLLAECGHFTHIRVQQDLAGRERVVLAESPNQ